jgi:hypothetical protein
MKRTDYGWAIEITTYRKGTMLFGANFNTNEDYGEEEAELYLCIYLFKIGIYIGKFHHYSLEDSEE